MKNLFIPVLTLVISVTNSCNVAEENNDEQNPRTETCDTLVESVIKLIELQDSIHVKDEHYSKRYFTYSYIDKDNNIIWSDYPILTKFHDSLDKEALNKVYGESFFTGERGIDFSKKLTMFDSSCANLYTFISEDSAKQMIKDYENNIVKGNNQYYSISYPLFTYNSNYLIIELDKHCSGLCGDGCTFVFKRDLNGWIIDKKIFRWIS